MAKIITLIVVFILMLVSLTGSLYLSQKISTGAEQIAAGEIELAKGQKMLAQGKSRLARGKQKLSTVKTVYQHSKFLPFMGFAIVSLPVTGVAMLEAHNKIAAGEEQVAQGNERVKSGEEQLAAGQLELSAGKQRLQMAKHIRFALGVAAVGFGFLFLGFVLYWRKRW